MLVPLSWLSEYVDISLKPKELAQRLSEVGIGVEKMETEKENVLFELEITPNRPDLLSIIGVAREIAAIEKKKIKYPKLKTDLKPTAKILPLKIHPNYKITPRLTAIIIDNVKVGQSPKWLQDRLTLIGQRPINNIVDITNFVMYELGNPIHSFDYHKITGEQMWVKQAKGGEEFESVDQLKYHLPKGAIVYEDSEKIFDLVGIKGSTNSGTYEKTKAVLIVVEVNSPILIRRTSQALALRSDASAIFERAVNRGGTIDALKRTVDLILETAGGEIASELYDLKEESFEPWKLSVRKERIEKLLGVKLTDEKILSILESLNLSPQVNGEAITCTIPTYRNDLKIEEDLIEEVARIYGYSNFPKTIPKGEVPIEKIPYFKDYRLDEKIKQIFIAAGFSEIYTYGLLSEQEVVEFAIPPDQILRVDNPISRDFEYLRPTLRISVTKAFRQNKSIRKDISLFEMGKVYRGSSIDKKEELPTLAGITNEKTYYEVKGVVDFLFKEIGMELPYVIDVVNEGILFEINLRELLIRQPKQKIFEPLPKYPPVIEDLSITVDEAVKTGDIISEIKKQSQLILEVSLLDKFEDKRTFHIIYQKKEGNLTKEEVTKIREKIIKSLKEKFKASE